MSTATVITDAGAGVSRRRAQVRVEGTVQGVGFRPYVHRLASELTLAGYVLNDARGVLLEVEGDDRKVERFLHRLAMEAPPLAVVERVLVSDTAPIGERDFTIRASPRGETANAPVTPDSATCEDCLCELFDASDRRYRYPFINCTNCGPRFTIVRGVPYDRPLTTMAGFQMCDRCRAEYEDPSDRRFHAQPNACPECGPRVTLLDRRGSPVATGDAALQTTAAALRDGRIVAIKGIGGFHLACRADDEQAVATLRARKHREDKPFALMTRTLAEADSLVQLDEADRELISGLQRPIVLAPRQPEASIATAVAPGMPELGVMLPYSPLHHLVLADVDCPLVMTSGNVSDEPIAFVDADALERLVAIADLLLVHDRPIETRTDDSVVRTLHGGRVLFVRRSRGYVPNSIPLPVHASRPILGCGAELKNTFCLAKGTRAWVSHHVGDLQNYETLRSFSEGIEHFQRLFAVTPEVVVHDLHPDYLSTHYAFEREGVRLLGVQHHHAHLAAVLAEHGELGAAVGAIFDGTGYGTDGTIWGGELLVGGVTGCERVSHLPPVPMPGGERAIHEPWRMACAWLDAISDGDPPPLPGIEQRVWEQILRLGRSGQSVPQTTSVGRLFDAVAAICGICATVNYEGQAAVTLEAACDPGETGAYPITLQDPRDGLLALLADVRADVPVGIVATRFHRGLAAATIEACMSAASSTGVETVVLGGGVWVNRRLLEAVDAGLTEAGLRVLLPRRLPPGDGAISYGQAAIAASFLGDGEEAVDPSPASFDRRAGSSR